MRICSPVAVSVAAALAASAALQPKSVHGEDLGEQLSIFKDCEVCPEMVIVPPGTFVIGSPIDEDGRLADEGPQKEILMRKFAIGKYEISFYEYNAFANLTGQNNRGDGEAPKKPVVNVSLRDALAYVDWLSAHTGKHYRLPTSAEWEYAARAGSTTAYPWGDDIGENLANCVGCGSEWDARESAPVGSFPPNAWGIYDTVGNVWEWTCSKYEGDYSGDEEQACTIIEAGNYSHRFVTRSGGYDYPAHKARSASHRRLPANASYWDVGFRVVVSP